MAMRSVSQRLLRAGAGQFRSTLARPQLRALNTLAIETTDANVDPRRTKVPICGRSPSVADDAFVAPSATLIGQVELAHKSGVWYNAVLRETMPMCEIGVTCVHCKGDMNTISVGYCSHIKDGTVVCVDASLAAGSDASTVIGSFVTIGTRCYLKACTIQDNAIVGDGCIVQEGALVEAGAVLEAGSVVPAGARVPAGEVWGGNPLTFVRKLEKAELDTPGMVAQANYMLGNEHGDEFLPHGSAYQTLK